MGKENIELALAKTKKLYKMPKSNNSEVILKLINEIISLIENEEALCSVVGKLISYRDQTLRGYFNSQNWGDLEWTIDQLKRCRYEKK
jgi:hypothetical protein